MGAKGVRIAESTKELNTFTRCLLQDIKALERMLQEDWFENEQMHLGAEQEICLIDEHKKPAPISMELLSELNHPNFTTELARFNLEINLDPVPFKGNCFTQFETQLKSLLDLLQEKAAEHDATPLLTGILPTIRKFDLEMDKLTPIDRYYALMDAIQGSRGESYELKIEGLDELNLRQASALIEACNTSFQVHLQVRPSEFVDKYNIAQAVTAPVMAVCTNSPMLFGKRLWHETRVALFQQSVDTRVTGDHLRYSSPRVTFGSDWARNSILDLYQEAILRYKTLLITDVDCNVMEQIEDKITPQLKALNIHNSTVYRWNRPCYGISPSGKPHLRIENRIFPSGPSVPDELANAAFWTGLVNGFDEYCADVTQKMDFSDAKSNFIKACRNGLGSKFNWINGRLVSDVELILKELIPVATEGLKKAEVDSSDIDKYMGIIHDRVEAGITGSSWVLDSYAKLIKETTRDEATTAIVDSTSRCQQRGEPCHTWPLASLIDNEWKPSSLLVEEFMDTDLFTVSPDDLPEFCADVMRWRGMRYMAVEDKDGQLIGLITTHTLIAYFSQWSGHIEDAPTSVKDIMIADPITVGPEEAIVDTMHIMRSKKIGCLPVISNHKLVGMITEENFIQITERLLQRYKQRQKPKRVKG
jgi:CBS domain-containing protein/gamma-glutamylcysteine synthetase